MCTVIKKKRTPRMPKNLAESPLIYIGDNHYVDPATGMILSRIGALDVQGYERVTHNGNRSASGHRVVYEAVHGAIPDDLVINHKNSDRSDNRPSNLEAVTQGENVRHAFRMGRHPVERPWLEGAGNPASKLTDSQRDELVRRAVAGEPVAAMATELGITAGQARRVIGQQAGPRGLRDSQKRWIVRPVLKVTPEQVNEIRARSAAGERTALLAVEFGISVSHTQRLIREGKKTNDQRC